VVDVSITQSCVAGKDFSGKTEKIVLLFRCST
jgi:hypothetical protein